MLNRGNLEVAIKPCLILIRGSICAGKTTTVALLKEKIAKASHIDFDAFKRSIDWTKRSVWRTRLAYKTALTLAEELMLRQRNIIADIHASQKYQYFGYRKLAKANNYELFTFLLYCPLCTCLSRNIARPIEGVQYQLSAAELTTDWYKAFRLPNEPMLDSSRYQPEELVGQILSAVQQRYSYQISQLILRQDQKEQSS